MPPIEYPGTHTFEKWSWKQALMAYRSALRAALWSDLIEPDIYQWLIEPLSAGMAAINVGRGAPASAPTNG